MKHQRHIAAGYTHLVSWDEYDQKMKMFHHKSFPTTPDAVKLHQDKLYQRDGVVRNITVQLLKDIE